MSRENWQRLYLAVSGTVFLLVAVFHLFRLVYQWPIVVGSRVIPMSLSYVGLPGSTGYCAWACWLLAVGRRGRGSGIGPDRLDG